jgi:hypothetical protein
MDLSGTAIVTQTSLRFKVAVLLLMPHRDLLEDSLAENPLRKEFDPHGASPNSLMRKLASFNGRMLPELAFSVYGEIIENFSTRSLTNPSDTVNAITGINKVAVSNLGQLLCAGGPGQLIEYCLIWFHQIGRTPIRNDYFASWSWAGWKCPVSFKLANEIFRDGTRPIFHVALTYTWSRGERVGNTSTC